MVSLYGLESLGFEVFRFGVYIGSCALRFQCLGSEGLRCRLQSFHEFGFSMLRKEGGMDKGTLRIYLQGSLYSIIYLLYSWGSHSQ